MKLNNTPNQFSEIINNKYEIYDFRHAATIFKNDFPEEYSQLIKLLENFSISKSDIETPGGSKSSIARKFDASLYGNGWVEKTWDIDILIDQQKHPSPTHNVDYFKNNVAIELEWNNKDPFFDRDLNNFRLLHQLGVISLGVIVTRADELQEIFNGIKRGASFGASTTHIKKLLPKIVGGGAAECPLLVFGIGKNTYVG